MRLIDRILSGGYSSEQRAVGPGLMELFETWQGANPKERIEDDFRSYVNQGYKVNGVIFAVILARIALFSGAKFAFRNQRTKEVFGTPALGLLETPWINGTSGELLARMEQDVSLSGNAYVYKASPTELQRLRPDWVEIISDGAGIIGYLYTVGGPGAGKEGTLLLEQHVAHWSPIPDPMANYRGVSWLSSVLGEIQSDAAMTRHKQMFFERAATPNMLITMESRLDVESRERLRTELNLRHEGLDNAYRTMVLDGGADAKVIGSTMQALSFDVIQAAGENRIASAGGVPGIVVGLKEGLQAATYSNYAQAMRRFVDLWGYPQWRSACACLAKLVDVPAGAELWYDTADIPALRQSEKDQADIILAQSTAIVNLIRAGYDGTQVAKAVISNAGLAELTHTGFVYFPGAQAYTSPGEAPPGGDGTTDTPALDVGLSPPKALNAGRSLKVVRDANGQLSELVYAADDIEDANGA